MAQGNSQISVDQGCEDGGGGVIGLGQYTGVSWRGEDAAEVVRLFLQGLHEDVPFKGLGPLK